MKEPKPFFRSGKNAWYVQLRNGGQKALGKHPEGEPAPKRDKHGQWHPPDDVLKEYHKLMLHEDTGPRQQRYRVRELFDIYLDYCERETASYSIYAYFLNLAAKSFGTLWLDELRPLHLTRWLNQRPTWNDTTRNMVITVVKAAINYCVKQGYIDGNPIRLMPVPPAEVRDRILTKEEREQIFGAIKEQCFADYLLALQESGARPREVAKLTPENVNLELGIWVLPKHKTKRKTGKARIVYLTPVLLELTRRLLSQTEPGQTLFRNTRGNPWGNSSLCYRFENLRKKFPHLKDVVPRTFRATFATDALESGVPEATVSELLGHRDTRMLHKHYSKLSKKVAHLREMAERARSGCAATAEGPEKKHPA